MGCTCLGSVGDGPGGCIFMWGAGFLVVFQVCGTPGVGMGFGAAAEMSLSSLYLRELRADRICFGTATVGVLLAPSDLGFAAGRSAFS